MELLIANPRRKAKKSRKSRRSSRRMTPAQRKYFMPKKSRRRRSRRRSVVARSTPRRTTAVVRRRGRRRHGSGMASGGFNLKTIAKQGAVAGGGLLAADYVLVKFGAKLGLNTPMKQVLGRAAIGAGLGYVVSKYAKMPWAGVAIAIGSVAVGLYTAVQLKKQSGVSGLGAVNQWTAERLDNGQYKTDIEGGNAGYLSGMGAYKEDPQAIRMASA